MFSKKKVKIFKRSQTDYEMNRVFNLCSEPQRLHEMIKKSCVVVTKKNIPELGPESQEAVSFLLLNPVPHKNIFFFNGILHNSSQGKGVGAEAA
jgi:hypothetical protein